MKNTKDVKGTYRTLLENITSIIRVPKKGNKKKQDRGNIWRDSGREFFRIDDSMNSKILESEWITS